MTTKATKAATNKAAAQQAEPAEDVHKRNMDRAMQVSRSIAGLVLDLPKTESKVGISVGIVQVGLGYHGPTVTFTRASLESPDPLELCEMAGALLGLAGALPALRSKPEGE